MLAERDRVVQPQELCVGAVVWLRQRFEGEQDIPCVRPGHCTDHFLAENGYMHPMVVLKFWQQLGSDIPGDLMVAVSEVSPGVVNFTVTVNTKLFPCPLCRRIIVWQDLRVQRKLIRFV